MDIYVKIRELADKYASELKNQVNVRVEEMKNDDTSHYLIYRVLGITNEEGNLIDLYQNKGRFLYKYAGAFLEEAACMCIKHKYSEAAKVRIPNTSGSKEQGYTPVRVMFYYPQRSQAKKIQETIETLYKGIGGQYYYGDAAWKYIKEMTDVDLLDILHKISDSRK